MDSARKKLYDFIMERAQEGKREQMEAALEDFFKPPQGPPDPEVFRRRIEAVTALLKPEAVPEFHRMIDPFGGDDGEPVEIKNPQAAQPREMAQPLQGRAEGEVAGGVRVRQARARDAVLLAHPLRHLRRL